MSLRGVQVLVTGAGGFIGSHLVEALVEEGTRVRAFVHYNSRSDWGNLRFLPREILERVDVVPGDIADPSGVRSAVRGCDVVFHLAALIGIPYSYVSPWSYLSTNIAGTLNVLEACREQRLSRLIHTSTSETYGTAQYVPIDEGHPLQGQSPYSASKIGADKIAESYHRSFDLPVVTIRPFNTYGPRQSARAVIPTIISQIAHGRERITLGSVNPIRDFTYVKDTVAGFLAVAGSPAAVGSVVNIGYGRGIKVSELASLIAGLMGREDLEIATDESRVRPEASEVMDLVCANQRAKQLAGWEPTWSLVDGLKETISFVRAHLELFVPDVYTI